MELDNGAWKEHRMLQQRIKNLGMTLDEVKALLQEYEASSRALAQHRSQQFAQVIERVSNAKDKQEVGAILRRFAEHVIEEARINGIKPRDAVEDIVDQIADME